MSPLLRERGFCDVNARKRFFLKKEAKTSWLSGYAPAQR
jgi:hypothetical protein